MFKRLREELFGRTEAEAEREQQPAAPEAQAETEAPEASQPETANAAVPATLATQPVATTPQTSQAPLRSTPAGSLRGPFAPPAVPRPQAPPSAPPSQQPAARVSERSSAAPAPTAPVPASAPADGATSSVTSGAATASPVAPSAPAVQAALASPTAPPAAPQTPRAPATQSHAPALAPAPVRPAAPAPVAPMPKPKPAAKLEPITQRAPAPVEDEFEEEEEQERQGGRFRNPFRFSLGKTRALFGQVNQALEADEEISDELWDELEETLIGSDVGVQTSERLLDTLRERVRAEGLTRGSQLRDALKEEMAIMLGDEEPLVFSETSPISVFLLVGVNGVGKTTTIAKMASVLKKEKHRVLLAAGDTFRAAATEQLNTWGERVGVPVIAHQHGADPGAVVFDAMQAAQARKADVLIVDTAGRLHTKFNLMQELKKIVTVLQKYDPEAPHEVLLVIDATTGQNGFLQAKQFVKDAGVSGIILTKLDGTARGGIVFAIAAELGLPIKYVGTGERVNDLALFDPDAFVDALFEDDE